MLPLLTFSVLLERFAATVQGSASSMPDWRRPHRLRLPYEISIDRSEKARCRPVRKVPKKPFKRAPERLFVRSLTLALANVRSITTDPQNCASKYRISGTFLCSQLLFFSRGYSPFW